MRIKQLIQVLLAVLFVSYSAQAHIDPAHAKRLKEAKEEIVTFRADCQPGQAQTDLDVNNVRARLLTSGDLWWDLDEGSYIVPNPAPGFPAVSSIFAGGVWIGGEDPNGNLKLAGVTYRSGNATDFYPGPLDDQGITESEICDNWDRFFEVDGENVRRLIALYDEFKKDCSECEFPCDSIPDDVKYWPAQGNPFFNERFDFPLPDQELAAFWDDDGDGFYNPCNGDFPVIDIRDCEPSNRAEARELLPDEMIFWIYNDNGGPHRESLADPIQMEVQVQAFAYATNDEVNDMTFYRFALINKATDYITDCYFAMWVDPDLGCYSDDYIGADLERDLAYVYNEDAIDGETGCACPGGVNTYCEEVPILGVDYFRGPRGPRLFVLDEDGNAEVDEDGNKILVEPEPGTGFADTLVELGMSSFVYNNNCGVGNPPPGTCDPQEGEEYYRILQGLWRDGTATTFGGNGYNPGSTDSVKYVFDAAPNNPVGWSMCNEDLPFGDRRTIQATGPLLLQAGARNELIVGAVWVPNIDYPCPDISRLQFADDLAQALFDNCFDITDGPDAPDLYSVELDQQLILLLSNDTLILNSNNAYENYSEKDLQAPEGTEDSLYRFEGYKIYQLRNPNVTVQELDDVEKARLIRQVDVRNGVSEIFNWSSFVNPNVNGGNFVYTPERQVAGEDVGIAHSFNLLEDAFATSDRRLVNHKDYYFTVVAYAYNSYETFDQSTGLGQARPYLEGRKNVDVYTFTPRPIIYTELQAAYGQEAQVTRIEGVGTGLNSLDLVDGTYEEILNGSFNGEITYERGFAPINPRVIDPLSIKDGEYTLRIEGEFDDNPRELKLLPGANWVLTNETTGQVIASEKTIDEINEQIIYGEGFSLSVNQVGNPGDRFTDENGALGAALEYADPSGTLWFDAVPAASGYTVDLGNDDEIRLFNYAITDHPLDPTGELSDIGSQFFNPFYLSRWEVDPDVPAQNAYITPAWKERMDNIIDETGDSRTKHLELADLNNVDIVFTSDKNRWSKCVVVESAVADYNDAGLTVQGEVDQFELRAASSIDRDGNMIEGEGFSYFPGYAIDVETGERLNIFFGENSFFDQDLDSLGAEFTVGGDMIWNPNDEIALGSVFGPAFAGGQHYIYVTREPYDGCENIGELLRGSISRKSTALSFVTWTAIPMPRQPLNSLDEGLIPNDVTVKLRVTNAFNRELQPQDGRADRFDVVSELPEYQFSFNNVEALEVQPEEIPEVLANIQVVPNPYYAYSSYERSQFDNTVKVTNLPANATVTIYSIDGKFIREFKRAERVEVNGGSNPVLPTNQIVPNLEWDLNNAVGIPVASGVYLFHIVAEDFGVERTIKWFGVNRKFDPTGL